MYNDDPSRYLQHRMDALQRQIDVLKQDMVKLYPRTNGSVYEEMAPKGVPMCDSTDQGYGCTLRRGHFGARHIAHGPEGRIIHHWPLISHDTRPLTYLAGPMDGMPDYNRGTFAAAALSLRKAGHTVYSPAEHYLRGCQRETYLRKGLMEMLKCDRIVMLPGWADSEGASLEYRTAVAVGIFVYHWNGENRPLTPESDPGSHAPSL